MHGNLRRRELVAAGLLGLFGGRALAADAYPSKPIRLILGFAPGGGTDAVARIVAEAFQARLGQPVVVENRAGANGSLAAAAVAGSEPDGYTLLLSNASTMTVNHLMYRKPSYLPLRDLFPVTTIVVSPYILAVNPKNPRTQSIKRLQDFVALAKLTPGGVSYGSAGGQGNSSHLGFESLSAVAGIKMLHVPYKGEAPAQQGILSGDIDAILVTPAAVPLLKSGVLLPLACTGAQRWRDLPDVPTIAESGYPGFEMTFFQALVAPAKTPPAVIDLLHRTLAAAAQDPATRKLLEPQGEVVIMDPQQFRQRIERDIARNAEIIQRTGIELQ